MIQTSESLITYNGNNSTVIEYPVPFLFYDNNTIHVIVRDDLGIEEEQAYGTDFTLTGAGNPDGGNLLMTWAVPAVSSVTIFRAVPFTQLTAYEEGDAFPAKAHERALDKLTMECQQLSRSMGTGTGDATDLGTAFRISEASGTLTSVGKINDSMLGIDSSGTTVLRTPSDLLGWLGQVGTVWADTPERINTRGAYAGQLGVQLDNYTVYIAHSTEPGDWLPFLPGTGIVYATDGIPEMHPAPEGDLVGTTEAQVLTNKTFEDVTVSGVSGLTKADVGLANVDNTSDVNKPISAPTNAALSTKQPYSEKGFANGYASLDATGKVPAIQLPSGGGGGGLVYKGNWNASTNSPSITTGSANAGNNGWFYVVSVAGSTTVDGTSSWALGDWITSNGTIWQKIPNSAGVSSVEGRTGAVDVTAVDVGLGNVDNTSDATKNSAAATLTNKTIDGATNTLNVRLNTSDVSGNLPTSRLNNGTGAGTGTFWRGDGSWAAPSGTGDMSGPNGSADGELPVFSGTTGKIIRRYTGGTGFAKLQNNAAVTPQPLILAPDLDPGVIHAQTQKTSAIVDADEFMLWDSSVSALRRIAAPLVRHLPGEVVKTSYVEQTAEIYTDLQGSPPYDNTDGIEFLSLPFASLYANSKLLITCNGPVSLFKTPAAYMEISLPLFVSGTTAPIIAYYTVVPADSGGPLINWSLQCFYAPGVTTSKTYSVRALCGATAASVYLYINGYGAVSGGQGVKTTMTIQEIKQ